LSLIVTRLTHVMLEQTLLHSMLRYSSTCA